MTQELQNVPLEIVRASEIEPRQVEWLWYRRMVIMLDNKSKKKVEASNRQVGVAVNSALAQIILGLLKEIDPEIVQNTIEREILEVYRKDQEHRERDAARKRLARLCTKIMAAPTPEDAARIKAEYYPKLTLNEITKIETKLHEKVKNNLL